MGGERIEPQKRQAHMSGCLPETHLVRYGEIAWSLSRLATGGADIPLAKRDERDAQSWICIFRT